MKLSTAKIILSYMENIASTDETRQNLQTVLIEAIDETPDAHPIYQVNIVATDGHKLSKVTVTDKALHDALTAHDMPARRSVSINTRSADTLKIYIKEMKEFKNDTRLVPTRCLITGAQLSFKSPEINPELMELFINDKPIGLLNLVLREFPRYQAIIPTYSTFNDSKLFEFSVNVAYLEQLLEATKANLKSKRSHDDQLIFTCLIDDKTKKTHGYQTTLGPIMLSLSERAQNALSVAGDNSFNRTMIIMPCKTAKLDRLTKAEKAALGEV